MHYVRLLRPVKVVRSSAKTQVSLVVAVTTDLGDSLLHPDEAVELVATRPAAGSPASGAWSACSATTAPPTSSSSAAESASWAPA